MLVLVAGCSTGGGQSQPTSVPVCQSGTLQRAEPQSIDDLITNSSAVVIGSVERVLPSRIADDVRQPVTEFDLHVAELLRGSVPSETLRVRQYGGSVAGCKVEIVGYAPRPGDYGAFFLSTGNGAWSLAAPQGAYVLDANGRDLFLFTSPSGATEPFSLKQLRTQLGDG